MSIDDETYGKKCYKQIPTERHNIIVTRSRHFLGAIKKKKKEILTNIHDGVVLWILFNTPRVNDIMKTESSSSRRLCLSPRERVQVRCEGLSAALLFLHE